MSHTPKQHDMPAHAQCLLQRLLALEEPYLSHALRQLETFLEQIDRAFCTRTMETEHAEEPGRSSA